MESILFYFMTVNARPWSQPWRSLLTDSTPEFWGQCSALAKAHMSPTEPWGEHEDCCKENETCRTVKDIKSCESANWCCGNRHPTIIRERETERDVISVACFKSRLLQIFYMFFSLLDPVHSHQRYHSDYSSSSESPSITSSDPDYRQGRNPGKETQTI